MTVTRKLLTPAIVFFALVLAALIAINTISSNQLFKEREETLLENLYQSFQSQLDERRDFALALATQVANNAQVQAAFAARDRDRLIELTHPAYLQIDEQFDVPQHQFHLAPATSFLRLHQLNRYGDDLSTFRFTVLAANAQKQPIAGPEIGRAGLGVRGVAPVTFQNEHLGTVEFGLNIDQTLIGALKNQFGADWQILLNSEMAQVATFEGAMGETKGPIPTLLLQASTLDTAFFGHDDNYRRALGGDIGISRTGFRQRNYVVLSAPLRDFSGNVIGVVDIISDRTETLNTQSTRFIRSIGVALLALAGGGGVIALVVTRTLRPIGDLTTAASEIAAGDLDRVVRVEGQDEISALANAFNSMTTQLRELIGSLEKHVKQRTHDMEESNRRLQRRAAQLEASTQVAHAVASVLDPDELLHQVVHLISDSFGHYHAGIFTLDESGDWAVLRAANSQGGQRMLARAHQLEVGVTGIVGAVAHTGQPRIALDVGTDAVYFDNPDMPETRSEMALPLIARGQVVGVLDVQSTQPNAFDQEDLVVLSTLADQIAIALDNAQLYRASQSALAQAQAIQHQYVQQAWQSYRDQRQAKFPEFSTQQSTPDTLQIGNPLRPGDTALIPDDNGQPTTVTVPLRVHGQVIGALGLQDTPDRAWTEQDIAFVETVADQVSQAMEAARLFEETQRRAQREQLVAEITSKIRSAPDMDSTLRVAVQEMRRVLGVSHGVIRLGTESHLKRSSIKDEPRRSAAEKPPSPPPKQPSPETDPGELPSALGQVSRAEAEAGDGPDD